MHIVNRTFRFCTDTLATDILFEHDTTVDDPCSMQQKPASDGRNYQTTFSNCPIEALLKQLEQLGIDRPVVDKTGLAGTYDSVW